MGRLFWLITAPAAWASGFAGQRLAASMGADRPLSIGIGLVALGVVAVFVQGLIDNLVAHRDRD